MFSLKLISLGRLQKDPPAGIAAVPSDDNILMWHAFILGYEQILIEEKKRTILTLDRMIHHLKMERFGCY